MNKYRMISLDFGPLHRHHDLILSKTVVKDAQGRGTVAVYRKLSVHFVKDYVLDSATSNVLN